MEKALLNKILLEAAKLAGMVKLFRNNTGQAYAGTVVQRTKFQITLNPFRVVKFGLITGGTDLIGWTSVEITPAMVGKKIAIFTGIEAKVGNLETSPAQETFLRVANEDGAIVGVARTPEQINEIIFKKIEEWQISKP